ncbi:MAG: xanthine dehydrogenase family protein molybdopterin-binding subunit [Actinomycetota bacterium]|jgi:carbon-monoxide dehydrogenase large subunit|nr:xanthine dehydrogenase family protein molybdopterin-binding subunit [Actinomycetota bacterium]
MPGSLLGNRVRRVEDPALLTGRATYVGNLKITGCLSAAFVRSPYAHARVRSVDTADAASAPGVVAVYVAADLGLPALEGFFVLNQGCARPPLATDKVRFVGDPVAVVVAESDAAASDAAELVVVDYEPLEAVVDPVRAAAPGAPLQFEALGTNVVAGYSAPSDPDPFAGAVTVVRAQLENQRVAVVPMEADAIAAIPGDDGDGHELTIYVSTQMPHGFWKSAAAVFGIDPDALRVVAPDVGGAFGSKVGVGAEHATVIAAARRLGRPVRWVQTRSEAFMGMPDGRGQIQWVQLGFDADQRITGMHCRVLGDAGAYAGFGGALGLGPTRMMAAGVYRIPVVRYEAAVAITNTTPMGAFRGAGRPEAAELLERMMDIAAAELQVDPVELRRRNLRPAFFEPVTTAVGTTYDTGDYEAALSKALELAGYGSLREEQAARRDRGATVQLGIGVGLYVEVTGGGSELGVLEVHEDGTATIRVGTSSHGQGHATALSAIVSDTLGISLEKVRFVQSDTALIPRGGGTGGSRSLQIGGSAVLRAAEEVLAQARTLAARQLEASPADVVVFDGVGMGVAGVPSKALSWGELARLAASTAGAAGSKTLDDQTATVREKGPAVSADGPGLSRPKGLGPLAAAVDFDESESTFPFGAHVSVVEVDTETGKIRPLRHVAVDDCGRIVNPLLVAGQQHGGIAQGLAQALFEEKRFDELGTPLTASLADYEMPSAAELPSFEVANTETPTFLNPLGAKGIGESGTIGSTPAVHNAVVDALCHLGVRHVAMPCTPERVWHAIQAARAGSPDAPGGGRPLWSDPPEVFATLPRYDEAAQPDAAGADI